MKVLLLPYNIASIPSITTEALNRVPGIEAKCLTLALNKFQSVNKHTIYLPKAIPKKKFIKWSWNKLTYYHKLKKLIRWADVLHYTWDSALQDGKDLIWAKKYKKSIFVEWLGSDIRIPEKLYDINRYYKTAVFNSHEYVDLETVENSDARQRKFASAGAGVLVCPEMSLFINKKISPSYYLFFQRIDCSAFSPSYPNSTNSRPMIVHSPTASLMKGTEIILRAIDELKKDLDFEFILIQNMTRAQAIEIKSKADIFIDQIIAGSYGMAALEAMSQGKPVLCHIMPKLFELGLPEDCPIVNANPDNLKEELKRIIINAELRNQLGIKSRQFVEKYHDADKLVKELITIYQKALQKDR